MPPVRLPASDGRDVPHLPPRPGVVRCLMEPSGPRIQMVSRTSILLRFAPTAPPFVNPPQPTQTCSSPSHLIQDSIGLQPTDHGRADLIGCRGRGSYQRDPGDAVGATGGWLTNGGSSVGALDASSTA